MPDITIPSAIIVSMGVIASALMALRSGDWKPCAITGVIGTLYNLVCFYRRLMITDRLLKEIRTLRAKNRAE